MRLVLQTSDSGRLERLLQEACEWFAKDPIRGERIRCAEALLRSHHDGFEALRAVAAAADHCSALTGREALDYWAAAFDRAAELSPEASVALYSLGDSRLLEAATEEIVVLMRGWGLLGAGRRALDLGCGIGRFLVRLAPELASIVGVELSPVMAATALARSATFANASVVRTGGLDLGMFRDGSFDLVLAVDTFPYLVAAGADLAPAHVREIARVLKNGGDFLLLNYSYRGGDDVDRCDVERLAAEVGFLCLRNGERPLRLWDGFAFHLRRIDSTGAK